jgi:xanthine dehydrogenase accessory factor
LSTGRIGTLDRCGAALGANDAVCVLTHDHKFDVPAIAAALATRCGYIGALGSRRTTEERARRLRAAGVTDAALRRVRAPIGLDLGARTPEETAIAICAEIITVRTGHAAGPLRDGTGPLHDASTGSLIRSPTGGLARLGDVEAEFPPTMPTKPARPERE